jgi:hypothetical protein
MKITNIWVEFCNEFLVVSDIMYINYILNHLQFYKF